MIDDNKKIYAKVKWTNQTLPSTFEDLKPLLDNGKVIQGSKNIKMLTKRCKKMENIDAK